MATVRIMTWGQGGHDADMPHTNLVQITDIDEEMGEQEVYYPPFEDVPEDPNPSEPEPHAKKGSALDSRDNRQAVKAAQTQVGTKKDR